MNWTYVRLLLMSCVILLFSAGYIPKNIIDKVTLVQMIVFEKKNLLSLSFVAPIKEKGNKVRLYHGLAHTMMQAKNHANQVARRPLVTGQLRVVLFSKKLAKEGIFSYVDTLIQDPSIGGLAYLAIIEGDVQKFLNYKYNSKENVSIYTHHLLEHNMKNGALPHENLNICNFKLYQMGNDLFLPIVTQENGKIGITGLALFKGDQMVGNLKPNDFFIFKNLLEKHKLNIHTFSYGSGYVLIQNLISKPQYFIHKKHGGDPIFSISIQMTGRLLEYTGHKNLSSQRIAQIEHKIEKELNHQSQKLIRKFQAKQIDPLGLGAKYKTHYRPFQWKEWKKIYPNIDVRVFYRVTLSETGTIE
ncbi:Ger(x)C family spore germination protein [Bacillus cereus]|uniref:Ger(x)C family spore germination protein n=1 Tax=Bacillus cereus TaxID=1396 RepID=UPI0015D47281|nr:Ger(x)C family spore germination protein [Bacillus cereus]